MKEVDPELKVILEQPIIVEFINGEIKEAQISKNEPEWSVNLKKGLALLFQAKVDVATWLNEEAMNQVNNKINDIINKNYFILILYYCMNLGTDQTRILGAALS